MLEEKSCGAVVFTLINGQRHYVIVRQLDGHHGFPKGHVEGEETELMTAGREIKEETGLEPEFITGFRYVDEYLLPHNNNIKKQVVYFLAEYSQQKLVPQAAEISQIELLPYNAAYKRLEFPGIRAVLQLAERYLQRKAPN